MKLNVELVGRYVDFHKDEKFYSGIVTEVKSDNAVVTIVDDHENEVEVLVSMQNIDFIHDE